MRRVLFLIVMAYVRVVVIMLGLFVTRKLVGTVSRAGSFVHIKVAEVMCESCGLSRNSVRAKGMPYGT
jgi:hypothetical protein